MRKHLTGLFAFMLATVLILCTGVSAQAMTVSYSPNSTRLSKGISVMKSGSTERNKLEKAIDAVVNTPLSVQSESEIQNAIISAIDSAMGKCGASNCWTSSNADYKVYIYQSEYTVMPKNGSSSDPSTADGTYSFSIALKWQQETDLVGLFSEKYAEYIPWITNKSKPSTAEVFTVTIKAKSYCETIGKSCSFEETTITDVPATCTEDGMGHTIQTCAVCGRVEAGSSVVIPATGHIEDEWMLVSEDIRPCNETGSETWELYCTECGELLRCETLETYAEHVIIPATCTEPETCAVCGEIFGAALGHKKNTYTVISEADCENDGLIGFYCTECGTYVTETIPALGHVPGDDYREGSKTEMQNLYNEYVGIKLTKAAPMSFASVATDNDTYYCYHCEYCGEVEMGKVCNHDNTTETFYKVTGYNSDGTPILGAVSTDVEKDRCSTDVARILVCDDCGETVFTNILAKHDHEYAIYLGTSATCAASSDVECRQKKCIYCGGTKTLAAADRVSVSGEYNMANHDKKSMENRTSVNGVSLLLVQGDCKTPSVYLTICSRCKALITEERVNEAKAQYLAGKKVEVWYKYEDHTWTEGDTVEANCEHAGHTTQVCSVCGEAGETMHQSVMAHSYEIDNDSTEWTLDENGMPTGVTVDLCCTVCSNRVHESASWIREVSDAYVAPTCSAPGKRTFSALVIADSDDYTFLIDVTLPIDPEAHVFGEYVSNNNATCTANCTETAECTLCHVKDTREIENTALEHNKVISYIDEIPATCSTEGSRIKVVICDMCNEEFSREPEVLDLNPDNHESEPVISEAVAATCTASGLTEGSRYECCGKVVAEQEVVPALGHEPREAETTNLRNGAFNAAGHFITTNCVTDGSYDIVYCCDRCGEDIRTETVQVKANGPHAYVIDYDCDRVTCTATAECQTAGCNSIITERSQISFVVEEQATCSRDAIGHYVAEFANELFSTWESPSEYLEGTRLEHIWGDPQYSMSDDFTACTCTLRCVREYEDQNDKCGATRTVNCTVTPVTVQEPTDCATEKKVKYNIVLNSEHGFDTVLFPEGRGTGEFGNHVPSSEPEIGLVRNGAFNEAGEFITSDCVTDGSYELVYKCSVPGCHEDNPVLRSNEVQVSANGPHVNTEVRTRTVTEATKTSNRWDQDYTVCLDCGTEIETGEPYEVEGTQLPDHVHTWTTYYTYGNDCQHYGDTRRKCSDPNCPDHADELVSSGTGYNGTTHTGTVEYAGSSILYYCNQTITYYYKWSCCGATSDYTYSSTAGHVYNGSYDYTSGSDCRYYGDKIQYCQCGQSYTIVEAGAGYRGSHTGRTYTDNPTYSNITSSTHKVSITTYCYTCGDSLGTSSSTESHSYSEQTCKNGGSCACGATGPKRDCEAGSDFYYEYSSASSTTHNIDKVYTCIWCGKDVNTVFYKTKSCSFSGCGSSCSKNCGNTKEHTPSGTISYLGGDYYLGNGQHMCPRTQKCSSCGVAVRTDTPVNCTKETSRGNYTKNNDSTHYVTIKSVCKECGHEFSSERTTESHDKNSVYINADSTSHQKKESCGKCGWSKTYPAESHNFVKVSSTRYECACGKALVNGVVKSIRPGEETMSINNVLIESDLIFEDSGLLSDTRTDALADVVTTDLIGENDVTTVPDLTETEATVDILLDEVLNEADAPPEENIEYSTDEPLEVSEPSTDFSEPVETEEIPMPSVSDEAGPETVTNTAA